ncbi:3'(2'),5'-bisphosphate nucleotidase [Pelagicoccus sp. SDUM812005]|uniref:3'(2'),5'-bisphosphate nucleotidase n=1 Tax=Pelagicoccus sp. SDUM812005 TaxID=3041257 RepID=UPI00280CA032|nr:3'(2'),5'-bisphosphate nucleotidase [Pelagicoccus sp. SDUM812005]MDQ8179044.1 3'(2'),5'-bisphosphate nucleotidase [Pelagicoccus sp. SDUM812005]
MPFQQELNVAKEAVLKASLLCSAAQRGLVDAEKHDKADKSPVTVADYGAQALVLSTLAQAFPKDPAVGEEDSSDLRKPENAELFARVVEYAQKIDGSLDADSVLAAIDRGNHAGGADGRFWTLDPIDGTKGFLRGEQYAVALALIENGQVVLGVLGCPNLPVDPANPDSEKGCILFAVQGQGAFQAPLSDIAAAVPISTDSVSEAAHAVFCESVESGHTAHGRSAAIAEALGTAVEPFRMDSQCKYAAVSRGQASVYLRLPTRPGYEEKIWDHAAGYVVLQEAGGKIADTFGQPLDFSLGRTLKNNKGIVATSPAVFETVVKAVVASGQSSKAV